VCRKWRQLALATPEVWTSIYIKQRIILRWNSNAKRLLAKWLERSATLPLTILFFGLSDSDSAVYHAVTAVMDLLNGHSARWYDVDFRVIPERYLHHLGSSLQKNILHRQRYL
jgi:hypothetical protein